MRIDFLVDVVRSPATKSHANRKLDSANVNSGSLEETGRLKYILQSRDCRFYEWHLVRPGRHFLEFVDLLVSIVTVLLVQKFDLLTF